MAAVTYYYIHLRNVGGGGGAAYINASWWQQTCANETSFRQASGNSYPE